MPPLKSEGYPSPPAAGPTAEKLAEDALRRLIPPGNSTFPWVHGVPYPMYGHLFYAGRKGIWMLSNLSRSPTILELTRWTTPFSASIACHTFVWLYIHRWRARLKNTPVLTAQAIFRFCWRYHLIQFMLIFLIWSFVPTLLVRRLSFCPSSSCFREAVQYRISQESDPTEADRYDPLILAKIPTQPTSSHFSIIGTVQSHLQAAQWVQYMPQDWRRDVNGTAEVFRDISIFQHFLCVEVDATLSYHRHINHAKGERLYFEASKTKRTIKRTQKLDLRKVNVPRQGVECGIM